MEQTTQQQAATPPPWELDSWWDELEKKPLDQQIAILQEISHGFRKDRPKEPYGFPLIEWRAAVERDSRPFFTHPRFIAWALRNRDYVLNPSVKEVWRHDSWWDELEKKPLGEQIATVNEVLRGFRQDGAVHCGIQHPRFTAWARRNENNIPKEQS